MTVVEDDARSVFLGALERLPDEWSAFVDQACSENAELRTRVNQLLHAHQAMGSIQGCGVDAPQATADELSVAERPGSVIGPYKLLERIGEGGFGVVFMAEQSQPIQRKVALKIIKPGMDTRQVIARFEAERQALALMDHPNIARVLDAGATESGRPFFVMELVRGVAVTDFCDQRRLPIRQRLELFVTICQAVQHAHQKGIIHRDLKPTNVLVTQHDGRPMAKVIDFGVAKATGQKLTDKTLFTGFAQLIGTPLYMSPEQAEMSDPDVDTRSDIYSLGVLLYELLTGTTPFDKHRLKCASFDELRRIIREEEPRRPSTQLSTLVLQAMSTVATQRNCDSRQLQRLVLGELDWIVMKALEKDRNRRYESASALAQDIQHYLADEPVAACPPSTMYRVRKFARRHRGPVLAATLVLLVLLGGVGVSTWQAIRASHAEQQAKASEQQALEAIASKRKATDVANVLREAIQANPNDILLLRAIVAALVNRAQEAGETPPWDEIASEFVRVIDSLSDGRHPVELMAACRELAQWDEVFNKLVALRPDEPRLWAGRGEYHALRSRWDETAADYSKVIYDLPVDGDANDEYAYLLLLLGDTQGYQQFCQRFVSRCGEPQDVRMAFVMARVCTAAARCDAADPARIVRWATMAADAGGKAWYPHTLGLALYRAGQFDRAIQTLVDSNRQEWFIEPAKAQNWLVMAMAHQRLGNTDQSRNCFETAHQLIDRAQPMNPGGPVNLAAPDWIEIQVLSREAEALLQSGDTNKPQIEKLDAEVTKNAKDTKATRE